MTVFLHIGSTKTGTTSIQRFMAQNRELLQEHGYIYPSFAGTENHTKLAVYGHEEGYHALDIRAGVRNPASRKEYREDFEMLFRYTLGEVKEHVVFSSEHCSAILHTEKEIGLIKSLLESLGQEIKIIFYARQQGDYLASRFSTNVITGRTKPMTFPSKNALEFNMDYYAILQRWEQVFGREAIVARVFEREKLVDGDVIKDFCSILGLSEDFLGKAVFPKRLNESLDFQTIEFLRLFNEQCPRLVDKKINPGRGNIGSLLQNMSNKRKARLPKKIFEDLQKRLTESNALFRERYVDGVREDPFNWEPKDNTRSIRDLSQEEVFRIFAKVWAMKLEEVRSGVSGDDEDSMADEAE